MIEKIEVHISNSARNMDVYIDCNSLEVKSNGISKHISKGTIIKFMSLVKSWKSEYLNDESEEKEEFNVIVTSNEGVTNYHGKGSYPKNYRGFKAFLTDIR